MELPMTAKPIEDSYDYIDVDGTVYGFETRKGRPKKWFKKALIKMPCGYIYCNIKRKSLKRNITMRVHKLVAKAFIPNPEPEIFNIVGHRNNIKTDNRKENLYWTTVKENTQKAVDDGLCPQDSGWDDSQSMPVSQYDTMTNELIGHYGSVSEAERKTGIPKATILRQCRYHRPVRKSTYFRFYGDESTQTDHRVIYVYDIVTDEFLGEYLNTRVVSDVYSIPSSVVCGYVNSNRKPKWSKYGIYCLSRKI